jgi:hypothetical protein
MKTGLNYRQRKVRDHRITANKKEKKMVLQEYDQWSRDKVTRGVPRILPGGMHIFG